MMISKLADVRLKKLYLVWLISKHNRFLEPRVCLSIEPSCVAPDSYRDLYFLIAIQQLKNYKHSPGYTESA